MALLRQYFETDFNNTLRVHVSFSYKDEAIEGVLLYDISAYTAYLSCYISGADRSFEYLRGFLQKLEYGRTQLNLAGKITLPSVRQFPGELQIANKADFEVRYRLFGDPSWRSTSEIGATKRVFLYSETNLEPAVVTRLQEEAELLGVNLQFRGVEYVRGRTRFEIPLAFISHDSRDKEAVARAIAINLERMLCPVWYDEFSLKVGDSLRESIEKGLKECKKCVLILSPNFLSSKGWTKKEFNSVFTREILEETRLVLPVWYDVTKQQVYEYSPSLLDIKGLDWKSLGEEETCRQLYNAIVG